MDSVGDGTLLTGTTDADIKSIRNGRWRRTGLRITPIDRRVEITTGQAILSSRKKQTIINPQNYQSEETQRTVDRQRALNRDRPGNHRPFTTIRCHQCKQYNIPMPIYLHQIPGEPPSASRYSTTGIIIGSHWINTEEPMSIFEFIRTECAHPYEQLSEPTYC